MASILTLFIVIFFLGASASAQKIYEWKDEKGLRHRSTVPPGSRTTSEGRFRVWKSPWNGKIYYQCLWPDGKVYRMVSQVKDCPSKEKMAELYANRVRKEWRQIEQAKKEKAEEIAIEREAAEARRRRQGEQGQRHFSQMPPVPTAKSASPRTANVGPSTSEIQILEWHWEIRQSGDISVNGELKNLSKKPLGVELQVILRDNSGRVIIAEDFWPASTKNIPPGNTWPISKYLVGRYKGVDAVELRIIDIRTW